MGGDLMATQLIKAAQVVEEQLDAEIERMEKMDEDDLESLRQKRMAGLKKQQAKKQEWLSNGHGQYEEIPEEKEFFNVTKKSENVVCHFYKGDSFNCKVLDKHLAALAPKHVETKFCKIDATKCPFLTDRLKIRVIPTMAVVKDAKTRDFIVGFTDLGDTNEFSTEMLEWRLARSDIINYSGDLMTPPDGSKTNKPKLNLLGKTKNKTIRGNKVMKVIQVTTMTGDQVLVIYQHFCLFISSFYAQ